MKRMLLGAVCLAAAGGLLRSEYEKRHLWRRSLRSGRRRSGGSGQPSFSPISTTRSLARGNRELLGEIDRIRPDLVLIGGDMMTVKKTCDTGPALHLVERLAARYPVYYGNGNHETRMERRADRYGDAYRRYLQAILRAGVIYLSDSTAVDGDLAITGIDLDKKYYENFRPQTLRSRDVERMAGPADRERFQILLAHSPLFFDAYREWGADLTLSGHFHGGTIRLPLLGGVMTPQYQFFLPCCAGHFERDGRHMIVSRGLGTHSVRVRFNNRPQLVVVHLKN